MAARLPFAEPAVKKGSVHASSQLELPSMELVDPRMRNCVGARALGIVAPSTDLVDPRKIIVVKGGKSPAHAQVNEIHTTKTILQSERLWLMYQMIRVACVSYRGNVKGEP